MRISAVATTATLLDTAADLDRVGEVVGSSAGASFDPHVAEVFLAEA